MSPTWAANYVTFVKPFAIVPFEVLVDQACTLRQVTEKCVELVVGPDSNLGYVQRVKSNPELTW